MNTATQTTPLAPAADPLAMMDMTPTTEMTQVVQTVAVQSNPQLPVVILSTITKPGSLINISQVPPVELAEVDKLALTLTLLNEQVSLCSATRCRSSTAMAYPCFWVNRLLARPACKTSSQTTSSSQPISSKRRLKSSVPSKKISAFSAR